MLEAVDQGLANYGQGANPAASHLLLLVFLGHSHIVMYTLPMADFML